MCQAHVTLFHLLNKDLGSVYYVLGTVIRFHSFDKFLVSTYCVLGTVIYFHSFIHSFNQQVFIEHLLFAKHGRQMGKKTDTVAALGSHQK